MGSSRLWSALVLGCTLLGCKAEKRLVLERPSPKGGAPAAPVLDAMKAELSRAFAELPKKADPPPYFLSYRVTETATSVVASELGALSKSHSTRERTLAVDVRIGDHELDSSHETSGVWMPPPRSQLPLDDEAGPMRAALWLATEVSYRAAAERWVGIKPKRADFPENVGTHDFSVEKPATFQQPPATLVLDRAVWEARVRSLSAAFRRHPEILGSGVALTSTAQTRWFASSEGSSIQAARTHARLWFWAETWAEDGTPVRRFGAIDASSAAGMPDDARILARIEEVIEGVLALRSAAVVETYDGPAILDGPAAAQFVHGAFGHELDGDRQRPGKEWVPPRNVGEQMVSDLIDIYDDPTVFSLNGVELNGHYDYDDEGVAAQRAGLVERGVLETFLMSRAPAPGVAKSNGHGRAAAKEAPVARQANLIVDPKKVVTPEALKKALLAEVAKQGKPYGIRFHQIAVGHSPHQVSGPRVMPVVVYRVHPDGREELVRAGGLQRSPLVALSNIMAAGNDFGVFNGECDARSGSLPVSAASPSLLLAEIELAPPHRGARGSEAGDPKWWMRWYGYGREDEARPLLGPPPLEDPRGGAK